VNGFPPHLLRDDSHGVTISKAKITLIRLLAGM
jgi:hypothetical protein